MKQFSTTALKMFFALLKATFKKSPIDVSLFESVTFEDWENCYTLCQQQGVRATAWDGVQQLPPTSQPPVEIKVKWALEVEDSEKEYSKQCHALNELTTLFQTYGLKVIILKGLGLSSYHPVPTHRECGDIDLCVRPTHPDKMSNTEAYQQSVKAIQALNISVDTTFSKKHDIFYFKDIMVENHRNLLNIHIIRSAASIDNLLNTIIAPNYCIIKNKYRLLIPSTGFNTIFIPYHAAQHFGSGICMHHLYDWASFLHREGLHIPVQLTDERFKRFIYAFTQLSNQYFDTHIKVPEETELAESILNDMLYSPFSSSKNPKQKIRIISFKLKRMLYLHHFKKKVFGSNLWYTIGYSILFHLRNPKTIFF